jgi:hypothetical protein
MSAIQNLAIDGANMEMACDIINNCEGLPFPKPISHELRQATIDRYGSAVGQKVLQAYQAGYVKLRQVTLDVVS